MSTITTLSGFVEYLNAESKGDRELFRGQRMDWPLLPHIARLKALDGSLKSEKSLLDEFKRQALAYPTVQPTSDWDWLALARHHGLPTRFIDWTRNPLAALWFAVEKPAKDGADAVLWHLTYGKNDVLASNQDPWGSVSRPFVFDPPHVSPRIRAQSSALIAIPPIPPNKQFDPVQALFAPWFKIRKLTIAPRDFCELRYDLDRCGVNAASMYPDLDGLARHLSWLHSELADEKDAGQDS